MGCSSCSTTSSSTSPGCKNNGTCGTDGCNKLNVYNWLADMELPDGQKPYNIVEVRFKGSRKEFFRNNDYLPLKTGDIVAVEGNPGHDIGLVSLAGELVRFQLKKRGFTETSEEIKLLYRAARPADIEKWEAVKALEVNTMYRARSIALSLNLRMKLSDVEYQGDGKKATFYYTADERVDFRELIKKLADEFKVRIEMRQIGMRQEASRLGGIGSCGRELCCSTWLTDFKIVSTSAARYQNLSLNPLKLAGQCGKLKCCLNYELDSYMDAISDIPDANSRLETAKGYALHRKTDIFKRMMWFAYTDENSGSNSDNWIALSVDRVKEIISMNKGGEKPIDLNDYAEVVEYVKPMDYADVVGQDSLTRMMDKKKKKKKKGGAKENPTSASAQPSQNKPQQIQRPREEQRRRPDRPANADNANRPPQQQRTNEGDQKPPVKNNPPQQRQEQQQKQRPPRQPQGNDNRNTQNTPRPQSPAAPQRTVPSQQQPRPADPAPIQQAPPASLPPAPAASPDSERSAPATSTPNPDTGNRPPRIRQQPKD